VQAHADHARPEVLGKAVVVVPAVLGLVGVAVGPDPGKRRELELPLNVERSNTDGASSGVEVQPTLRPVRKRDRLGLDEDECRRRRYPAALRSRYPALGSVLGGLVDGGSGWWVWVEERVDLGGEVVG
jgi:hypothetical protein